MNTLDDLKQQSLDFIRQLIEADFTGASRLFDSNLTQALPETKLKETWLQILGQVGPFQKVINCKAVEKQATHLITVTCQFEKMALDFFMGYTQDGQMSGFNIQPAPAVSYNPPAYVHSEAFHEVEVTIGSGEWALPGTLSLPAGGAGAFPAGGAGAFPAGGAGAFPAVVLVHGSGPQDRDESIGPNKTFRDLAWGLASLGVAVLRYEKRTKAHAEKFNPDSFTRFTVWDETIEDALSAVQLLRQTPGIDPKRIYVLGHSLGATLAPRIGQHDPSIAGLVVMAGMTRTLEDTILDQFTHIYNLSGSITDEQKAELEELKVKVARVKDPSLSAQVPATDLPLGITPAYWLDLRGYHPDEVAKSLAMRIFVLQGGRDYQVTISGDFPAWQKALAGKSNATLKVYPDLYHLFIAGEGPSTPQEYFVEGHVSEEVVQDVAGWIKE